VDEEDFFGIYLHGVVGQLITVSVAGEVEVFDSAVELLRSGVGGEFDDVTGVGVFDGVGGAVGVSVTNEEDGVVGVLHEALGEVV